MNGNEPIPPTVKLDGEVPTGVLEIIGNARRYVALVSPYVDRVPRIETELKLATQRGVKVLVAVRDDGDGKFGGSKGKEALDWLRTLEIDLRAVSWLHSKVYLNENQALVTSMNLLNTSWDNSHELAILLDKGPAYQRVSDYVFDRILKLGDMISTKQVITQEQKTEPRSVRGGFGKAVLAIKRFAGIGTCIRCGSPIKFDPDRPLCDVCYPKWAKYGNWEYPETRCHRCGETEKTSYARPLCRSCYFD